MEFRLGRHSSIDSLNTQPDQLETFYLDTILSEFEQYFVREHGNNKIEFEYYLSVGPKEADQYLKDLSDFFSTLSAETKLLLGVFGIRKIRLDIKKSHSTVSIFLQDSARTKFDIKHIRTIYKNLKLRAQSFGGDIEWAEDKNNFNLKLKHHQGRHV